MKELDYAPQKGTWTLTAPDGRTWQAESGLLCAAKEQNERIPPQVRLARIFEVLEEADAEDSAIDQALALSREERFVYKQCQKHRDYLWPVMVVHSVPMPMKEVCPNCEERHVHSTGVPSEQRASSKAGGTQEVE